MLSDLQSLIEPGFDSEFDGLAQGVGLVELYKAMFNNLMAVLDKNKIQVPPAIEDLKKRIGKLKPLVTTGAPPDPDLLGIDDTNVLSRKLRVESEEVDSEERSLESAYHDLGKSLASLEAKYANFCRHYHDYLNNEVVENPPKFAGELFDKTEQNILALSNKGKNLEDSLRTIIENEFGHLEDLAPNKLEDLIEALTEVKKTGDAIPFAIEKYKKMTETLDDLLNRKRKQGIKKVTSAELSDADNVEIKIIALNKELCQAMAFRAKIEAFLKRSAYSGGTELKRDVGEVAALLKNCWAKASLTQIPFQIVQKLRPRQSKLRTTRTLY